MPNRDFNDIRKSYEFSDLLESNTPKNPFQLFDNWMQMAIKNNIFEPTAMQIATVNSFGQPSLRTVLLKSFDENGFVFYTNYESKKGNEIQNNSKIALLFWFREHEQQIRIEGNALKTSKENNEKYFHSRPKDSQIAAFISNQSQVVENRLVLEKLFDQKKQAFLDKEIPLKESWGGFLVQPNLFEFWQGRKNRLHDRLQYITENNSWKIERLAP